MKQIKNKGNSIDIFSYNEDTVLGLIRGLDTENSDIINKASQSCKEIFADYLHNPNNEINFFKMIHLDLVVRNDQLVLNKITQEF